MSGGEHMSDNAYDDGRYRNACEEARHAREQFARWPGNSTIDEIFSGALLDVDATVSRIMHFVPPQDQTRVLELVRTTVDVAYRANIAVWTPETAPRKMVSSGTSTDLATDRQGVRELPRLWQEREDGYQATHGPDI